MSKGQDIVPLAYREHAVSILVSLLATHDECLQPRVLEALSNIAGDNAYFGLSDCGLIVKAGGLEPLLQLLNGPNAAPATAMTVLARIAEECPEVAALLAPSAGQIVELMSHWRTDSWALQVVASASTNLVFREAFAGHGGVECLVKLAVTMWVSDTDFQDPECSCQDPNPGYHGDRERVARSLALYCHSEHVVDVVRALRACRGVQPLLGELRSPCSWVQSFTASVLLDISKLTRSLPSVRVAPTALNTLDLICHTSI